MAQGVAPAQVIGNQGISENSPTLKNKAFPVIDHHDLSQEMPEWAMRDSNFCRFLRDLERFVLSATQNPTHICTRRLSLSSSNCFSHCLVPILSRLLSRNWWGAWWKGSSFASIYSRIPSSTSRGQRLTVLFSLSR